MEWRSRTSRLNHLKLKAEKLIILGFSAFLMSDLLGFQNSMVK